MIYSALSSARIAILLVSADFLASDFIREIEIPALLSASREYSITIYIVVLYPSIYKRTELAKFQSVNDPNKPLAALRRVDREKILVKLAELIEDHLDLDYGDTNEVIDEIEVTEDIVAIADDLNCNVSIDVNQERSEFNTYDKTSIPSSLFVLFYISIAIVIILLLTTDIIDTDNSIYENTHEYLGYPSADRRWVARVFDDYIYINNSEYDTLFYPYESVGESLAVLIKWQKQGPGPKLIQSRRATRDDPFILWIRRQLSMVAVIPYRTEIPDDPDDDDT